MNRITNRKLSKRHRRPYSLRKVTRRLNTTGQDRAQVDGMGQNKIRRYRTGKKMRRERSRLGRDRIGWATTGQTRTGVEKGEMQNRIRGGSTASVRTQNEHFLTVLTQRYNREVNEEQSDAYRKLPLCHKPCNYIFHHHFY